MATASTGLLARLSSPGTIADLSDDEDFRIISDEHQLLGSCISDPEGFRALVSSGRLALGLHRAILLSPAAQELVAKIPVTGMQPLESAWIGLVLSAERTAATSGDLIPAAIAVSQACMLAGTTGAIPLHCQHTLSSVLGVANAMSEGKQWGDCYANASERRGLADLSMLALRLLQTYAPSFQIDQPRPSSVVALHSTPLQNSKQTSDASMAASKPALKGFRRRKQSDTDANYSTADVQGMRPPIDPRVRRAPKPEQLLLTRPQMAAHLVSAATASQARMIRSSLGLDGLLGTISSGLRPKSGRMASVLSNCLRFGVGVTALSEEVTAAGGNALAVSVSEEVACRISALRALIARFGDGDALSGGLSADIAGTAATFGAEAARRTEHGNRKKSKRSRGGGARSGGDGELPGMAGAGAEAGTSGSRGREGSELAGRKGRGRRGKGRRKKMKSSSTSEIGLYGAAAGISTVAGFSQLHCSQRVKLACDIILSGQAAPEDLAISSGCSTPAAAAAVFSARGAALALQKAAVVLCDSVNSIARSVAQAAASGSTRRPSQREHQAGLSDSMRTWEHAQSRLQRELTMCARVCSPGRGDEPSFESIVALAAGTAAATLASARFSQTASMLWLVAADALGRSRLVPRWKSPVSPSCAEAPNGAAQVSEVMLAVFSAVDSSIPATMGQAITTAGVMASVGLVQIPTLLAVESTQLKDASSDQAEVICPSPSVLLATGRQPKECPIPLFRLAPRLLWQRQHDILRHEAEAATGDGSMKAGERYLRWCLDALAIPVMLRDGARPPSVTDDVLAEFRQRLEDTLVQDASGPGSESINTIEDDDGAGQAGGANPVEASIDDAISAGFNVTPLAMPPVEDPAWITGADLDNARAAREAALSAADLWQRMSGDNGDLDQLDEASDFVHLLRRCLVPGGWRSNGPGELRDYIYGRIPSEEEVSQSGPSNGGAVSSVGHADAGAAGFGYSAMGRAVEEDDEGMAGIMVPLPPLVPDPPSASGLRGTKAVRMAIAYRYHR